MPPAGAPAPGSADALAELVVVARERDRLGRRRAASPDASRCAASTAASTRTPSAICSRSNVDPAALLPEDNVKGHFDNNADALQVSPDFRRPVHLRRARGRARGGRQPQGACRSPTTYGDAAEHGDLAAAGRRSRHGPAAASPRRACRSARAAASSSSTTSRRTASTSSRSATWRSRAKCRAWSSRTRSSCCSTARSSIAPRSAAKPTTRRSTRRWIRPSRKSTAGCARSASSATAGQHKLAVTFVHRSFAESDERTRTIALEGGQERIQAAHALQIRGPLVGHRHRASRRSRSKIFICKPTEGSRRAPLRDRDRHEPRRARVPASGDRRGSRRR